MVKLQWKCVDRIVLPRYDSGVDYGNDRWLLLDAKEHGRVIWNRGSTGWVQIGLQEYSVGELRIEIPGVPSIFGERIIAGGRLTSIRLSHIHTTIAKYLKLPVKELPQLDPRKTFVLK